MGSEMRRWSVWIPGKKILSIQKTDNDLLLICIRNVECRLNTNQRFNLSLLIDANWTQIYVKIFGCKCKYYLTYVHFGERKSDAFFFFANRQFSCGASLKDMILGVQGFKKTTCNDRYGVDVLQHRCWPTKQRELKSQFLWA